MPLHRLVLTACFVVGAALPAAAAPTVRAGPSGEMRVRVTGNGRYVVGLTPRHELFVWERASKKLVAKEALPTDDGDTDMARIVTDPDGSVVVRETEWSAAVRPDGRVQKFPNKGVAFAPDGRSTAVLGFGGVELFDAKGKDSGGCRAEPQEQPWSFTSDGSAIVIAGEEGVDLCFLAKRPDQNLTVQFADTPLLSNGVLAGKLAGPVESFHDLPRPISRVRGADAQHPTVVWNVAAKKLWVVEGEPVALAALHGEWSLVTRGLKREWMLERGHGRTVKSTPARYASGAYVELNVMYNLPLGADGVIAATADDGGPALFEPDGKVVRGFDVGAEPAGQLAFTPDGKMLAIGSKSGTPMLWPLDGSAAPHRLVDGGGAWDAKVVTTPDGLAWSRDKLLFRWREASGRVEGPSLIADTSDARLVAVPGTGVMALGSQGALVAGATGDGVDAASASLEADARQTIDLLLEIDGLGPDRDPDRPTAIDASSSTPFALSVPTHRVAVGVEGVVVVFDTSKDHPLEHGMDFPHFQDQATALAFTPAGDKLLVADAKGVDVHDASTGATIAHWNVAPRATDLAVAPGGKLVAIAAGGGVELRRMADGRRLVTLAEDAQGHVAAATDDPEVVAGAKSLIDASKTTGEPVVLLVAHTVSEVLAPPPLATSKAPSPRPIVVPTFANVLDLELSPDGKTAWVVGQTTEDALPVLVTWDLASKQATSVASFPARGFVVNPVTGEVAAESMTMLFGRLDAAGLSLTSLASARATPLAWSSDGKRLLLSSGVWTRSPLTKTKEGHGMFVARAAPDLASWWEWDPRTKKLDWSDGRKRVSADVAFTVPEQFFVPAVAPSRDGSRLAVWDGGKVRIVGAKTGQVVASYDPSEYPGATKVSSLAFTPDGTRLVGIDGDHAMHWDLTKPAGHGDTYAGCGGLVSQMRVASTGVVVGARSDGGLCVWTPPDLNSATLSPQRPRIVSLAASQSGDTLYVVTEAPTWSGSTAAHLWAWKRNGEAAKELDHQGAPAALALASDGRLAFAGDGRLDVFGADGKIIHQRPLDPGPGSTAIAFDGDLVALGRADAVERPKKHWLELHEVSTGNRRPVNPDAQDCLPEAVRADQSVLVKCGDYHSRFVHFDQKMTRPAWDDLEPQEAPELGVAGTFDVRGDRVDGLYLLDGAKPRPVAGVEVQRGKSRAQVGGALAPDGRLAVLVGESGLAKFYETTRLTPRGTAHFPGGSTGAVAFVGPRVLASVLDDGRIGFVGTDGSALGTLELLSNGGWLYEAEDGSVAAAGSGRELRVPAAGDSRPLFDAWKNRLSTTRAFAAWNAK